MTLKLAHSIAATHSSLFFLLKGVVKYFYSTQSKFLSRWDRKGRMEVWQFALCAVCFRTVRVGSPGIPRPPPRAEIQDCQNGFPQFWCQITSCTGGFQVSTASWSVRDRVAPGIWERANHSACFICIFLQLTQLKYFISLNISWGEAQYINQKPL